MIYFFCQHLFFGSAESSLHQRLHKILPADLGSRSWDPDRREARRLECGWSRMEASAGSFARRAEIFEPEDEGIFPMLEVQETERAIRRVRAALDEAGAADIAIKRAEGTIFTVEDAAETVGAPPEEILKSLIFLVDGNPCLVLMSGVNKVDVRAVARALGGRKAKMARPEYVFEQFGFRVGGVPPVGYPSRLTALLDEDLFCHDVVWAAAGTDHAFFPVAPERLLRMVGGTRTALKKEAAER